MSIRPQLYDKNNKGIRNRATIFVIVALIVFIGFKYLIFDIVIPKTATLTVPAKWRMLPLRQPKSIVHDYLGEPIPASDLKDSTYEEWVAGSKGKRYFLRIDYASDTIAVGYSIRYNYSNWLVDRSYLIDSFSIKE